MATQKPDLTRVWANGAPPGNVVDPDTTTPGKVLSGWQAEVPPFEHFNFLQKWFTQGLAHNNEQGINVWDTNTTYPVGGLAKGSDGNVYKSLLVQSSNDPVSDDGSNWSNQDSIFIYLASQFTNGDTSKIDYISSGVSVDSLEVVIAANNTIWFTKGATGTLDGNFNLETGVAGGASSPFTQITISPVEYDIVVAYGQSNSVGLASTPVADISSAPEASIFAYNFDSVSGDIVPISNTMNHVNQDEEGASTGNAWTAFANEWIKRTGRGVVILSAGRGGKTISELSKPSLYYSKLQTAYNNTVAAMASQNLIKANSYLVWHQGENDQLVNTRYEAYKASLLTLISDVFSDFPDINNFGIAIVGCPSTRDQITWQRIQSSQYSVANSENTGRVSVVYEGCPTFSELAGQYNSTDGVHYSQKGYNEMGVGIAVGMSDWVRSEGQAQTKENERSRLSPLGVGFAQMHHASATVDYDSVGDSYSLLKKLNSPSAVDQYYPSFFDQIESSGDSAVRVRMGIAKPVVYDMAVTLDANLISNGVRAVITKYNAGEFFGFDVTFYVDIDFLVTTDTGLIFGGAPPVSNSFISSIVSAVASLGVVTLTHSSVKSVPTVSYYASNAMESGDSAVRSDGPTTTRVSTTGTNNAVKVGLKNVKLTRAQVQELGDFRFLVHATVSDEIDRV